jgi:dCMP deaminase
MNKWDKRFLDMARLVASWSKDPKRQVGCVLVDELNCIISTGYNGPPRGLDNFSARDRLELTIHAEENALLRANGPIFSAYTYPYLPCSRCMAKLAQANVRRIVSIGEPNDQWRPDLTYKICNELGINSVIYVN